MRRLGVVAVTGALLLAASPAQAAPASSGTGTVVAPTVLSAETPSTRKLSWRPPALTNPKTIYISASNHVPKLTAGQDYIIKMPTTPLDVAGGLILSGGRNIVLKGGEIKISRSSTSGNNLRGLYLKGQSGTVHIEGLRITGAYLADGINLDERNGGVVQLQNIRVDTVHGSYSGMHADVLQTWAGPKALRIDGLTGYTTYQGFFLTPLQYGPAPQGVDLRNVNIVGQSGSKYLFWRDKGTWPLRTTNVWASTSQGNVARSQYLYGSSWGGVLSGKPASGDIVPTGFAGLKYVSPGYL